MKKDLKYIETSLHVHVFPSFVTIFPSGSKIQSICRFLPRLYETSKRLKQQLAKNKDILSSKSHQFTKFPPILHFHPFIHTILRP